VGEERIKLAGGIEFIPGRRGGRYPHCNSLLCNSGGRALIDPASNKRLLRQLAAEGVEKVLLSHYHSDHLRDLKEMSRSAALVHAVERSAVETFRADLIWFPDEIKDETWMRRKALEVGGWGWPIAATFEDGDVLMLGDTRARVVHTPGHTPGHCCFWFPEERVLFTADIDLTPFGPWYGNAASDIDLSLASIRRLAEFEPEFTVTGHETGIVRGDIRPQLYAYAAVVETRHARVLEAIREPRTLSEVTAQAIIYGPFYSPTNSYRDQEWRMIRHHLHRAVRRGEAEELEGGRYRRRS
jgi:glyoxylase-like metal-dependent hydrolase (beta-lactamase superfamily II)